MAAFHLMRTFSPLRYLIQLSARRAAGIALLLGAFISALDYYTGVDVRVFPLYFIPVSLFAGTGTKRGLSAGVAFGTIAWTLSNALNAVQPGVYAFNIVSQAVAFYTVGYLVYALRRREQLQRELALTDPLTGLLNARAFHAAAQATIDSHRRSGRHFTAAYLDLDDFKRINSTLGHVGADRLLVVIGKTLRATLRSSDQVSRLAGDEFAVLLPDAGEIEARLVLSRLHEAVKRATQDSGTKTTFSMGALTFTTPPASVETMLRETDELMYRVKGAGKAQVVVEKSATPPPPQN